MDKIEKIRQEIERLKCQLIRGACASQIEMETNCKDEAYNEVLSFLDTLSEQPDKSLEEAAEKFARSYDQGTCDGIIQDGFIAGAKWQKEQNHWKQAEKQDYTSLTNFERAIHRGYLCAGATNIPVTIIKETAQDCLAQLPEEWISIEDSLPAIDEEVIVLSDYINGRYVKDAHRISFGHMVDQELCVDYNGWNIPGVTHWMPCPKVPGE